MPINVNYSGYPPTPLIPYTDTDLGDPNYVPWEITRFRRSVEQFFRRFGSPVLVKHRYTDLDVRNGVAMKAVDRDPNFGQSRYASFSLSTGYVSTELSPNEWYTVSGTITQLPYNPGPGYIQAPMYRGFGPSSETYVVELDRARDFFSFQPGGAMMNVEQGGTIAPWYPKIFDGDLIIEVVRDNGGNILSTNQVWEAKMVTPITMRGRDRLGHNEAPYPPNFPNQNTYGYQNTANRFIIQQQFDTALVPAFDIRWTGLQTDR